MSETAPQTSGVAYCVPDTNFFLHFQYFKDVDWPALIGSETVVIVITSPVLRELEKFKND